MGKDIALMAAGAGMALAYQKYKKPVMKKVDKIVDTTTKKINKELDNMAK